MGKKIVDPEVKKAFDVFQTPVRKKLMGLRMLIFDVAKETEGVGELTETLKWGQPGYLTEKTKSGSTVRIGREKKTDGDYAIYFKCRTTLVDTFKKRHKNKFRFEGNRAILFNPDDKIPVRELGLCIAIALTYHLDKKNRGKR